MEQPVKKPYSDFLEALIHARSVTVIKENIQINKHLDSRVLHDTLHEEINHYFESANKERYELLCFLQAIVEKERPIETNFSDITDTTMLYKVALKQPNIIKLKSLFLKYKHLVNIDLLFMVMEEREHYRPISRDNSKIMFMASLIINNSKYKRLAHLLWISSLFRQGQLEHGKKRLEQIKKQMPELQRKEEELLLLGLDISYARGKNDLRTAMPLMEKMIVLQRKKGHTLPLPEIIYITANVARNLGQYEKAIDFLDDMHRILQENDVWDNETHDLHLFQMYTLRGLVLEDAGRGDMAFPDYQEAYNAAVRTGKKQYEFVSLTNIAASFSKRGMMQESLLRFQELIKTTKAWGDIIMTASTHNNLASTLKSMDRNEEAIQHYSQAYVIKSDIGYKYGEVLALFGLADCYFELGSQEMAELFHEMAFFTLLQINEPELLATYAIRRMDIFDRPEEQQKNMDNLMLAYNVANSRDMAVTMGRLIPAICELYTTMGEPAKALELCQTFLQEHPDISSHSIFFFGLLASYAQLLLDNHASVKHLFDRLRHHINLINTAVEETVSDQRRAEMAGQSILLYNTIFRLLLEYREEEILIPHEQKAVFCFNLHELAKSRTLLTDLSARSMVVPDEIPESLKRQEQELMTLQLSYRSMNHASSEVFRSQRLLEIRQQLSACRQDIKAYAPDYVRARTGAPYNYQEVQQFLAGEQSMAFVSFLCDTLNTTIFVALAGEAEPRIFRCPVGRNDIEKAIKKIRRLFNGDPFCFPPYPPILPQQPFERDLSFLNELGATLLGFLNTLPEVNILCIAPHEDLHQLPFQAIRLANGQYLAERYAVVYTASISTTCMLQNGQKENRPHNSIYVACVPSKEDKYPALFELDLDLFDGAEWPPVTAVTRTAAAREKVLSAIAEHDLIHFSCHGYFDSSEAYYSGLVLSDGIDLPSCQGQGITWSQRNRFALTVQDLLTTQLKADLVTLNACSTALQGAGSMGDEWVGFARSLLLAGASSVISTMWNVDQVSSVAFLKNFYDAWLMAGSRTEKWKALSQAQRSYIYSDNTYLRHPYHWAAFTLHGNWH